MLDKYSTSPDRYVLLQEFAKKNRANMTEAESALWNFLKGNNLGVKFLRQHIIGDYIVDFVSRQGNLVIEVDGGYHFERKQQVADADRTQWLSEHGFNVIRFTNEEVLFDTDRVCNKIRQYLNLIKNTQTTPPKGSKS